jgi:hypothetical protein
LPDALLESLEQCDSFLSGEPHPTFRSSILRSLDPLIFADLC